MSTNRSEARRDLTSILVRFALLYVVVLAIPLLVGSVALWRGIESLRSDLRATSLRSLSLNQQLFATELERLEELALRIDRAAELRRLYRRSGPVEGPVPIWLLDAWNAVYDNVLPDPVLLDVIVYVKQLNVIFTSADIYVRPDIFTNNFFSFGSIPPYEVVEQLLDPALIPDTLAETSATLRDREVSVVAVRRPLPLQQPLNRASTVVFLLNADELRGRLQAIADGSESYAAVLDQNGMPIVSVTPPGVPMPELNGHIEGTQGSFSIDVDGRAFTGAFVVDPATRFAHVVLLPTRIFLRQAFQIQIVAVTAAVIAIVLGIVVSFIFAYRTSKPLSEIREAVRSVEMQTRGSSPLDFLSSSVERVVSSNAELRHAIRAQRPLVQTAVVERIMRDEYSSESDALSALEEVRVWPFGSWYSALLIAGEFRSTRADVSARKTLVRASISTLTSGWPVVDRGEDELVCFGVTSTADHREASEEFRSLAGRIVNDLRSQYGASFRVYVGAPVAMVTQISRSMTTARIARAHSPVAGGDNVVGPGSETVAEQAIRYPLNIEGQLVAATVAGDTERVTRLIDEVLTANYHDRPVTAQEARWLHNALMGSVLRLLEYLRDPERRGLLLRAVEERPDGLALETIRGQLTSIFTMVAGWFAEQRGGGHYELKKKLENYVKEHLLDHDLSLIGMADEAGVSEAYASSRFKEMFGENFVTYVERERLEFAQRLLVEEHYTVEQIAARVGYNSATSFRRAFKRRFGVPPSGGRKGGSV